MPAATDRATVPVLLVEDDASMAKLVRHLLELDGYRKVRHVYTGEQALAAAPECEIILLDHQLPDIRGIDLLPRLISRPNPPSVVMVTAHGNESLAATALRVGAEDYITKDHTLADLLPRILERVRRNRALRNALVEAERQLVDAERLAAIGEMTVTLHHELNNPLMVAMAEVEMLRADAGLSADQREALATVAEALDRITRRLRQATDLRSAQSTPYSADRQMIALDHGPVAEPAIFRGRALVHHPDQRVERVLSLLLRDAGFVVDRPASVADLQHAASDPGVTLVALPAGPKEEPLSGFVPVPDRRYSLVVLGGEQGVRSRAAGADHVIALPFDPDTVVGDLLELLAEKSGDPRT
ncbi:MAG: response regulator [Gemmatimonadota bacterium]|jgi:DNA-binding response OmpR family regulator|nr:response regulator [Gemmatimonadota bacterium]